MHHETKEENKSTIVNSEKIYYRRNDSEEKINDDFNLYNDPDNFESEEIYKDKTRKDDILKIRNIVKILLIKYLFKHFSKIKLVMLIISFIFPSIYLLLIFLIFYSFIKISGYS